MAYPEGFTLQVVVVCFANIQVVVRPTSGSESQRLNRRQRSIDEVSNERSEIRAVLLRQHHEVLSGLL